MAAYLMQNLKLMEESTFCRTRDAINSYSNESAASDCRLRGAATALQPGSLV
ncbi:UNVERIFIED_CONTAM: hypothetical protein Slati_3052500 [Sesamum latifolium]|uniref:Uncharacterized protein n=1 Tax=Sesamum latifolium TaxID=2727402 RepID=A0AAW2UYN0_9LAMI